jgi:NitT/TauT family transport system substrate-binding protein
MRVQRARRFSRRRFLRGATLAGTAGLLGLHARRVAVEPPPETTRIRLVQIPGICQAPQYVAEELLRSEGFTEVHYLQKAGTADIETALASGEADLNGHFAAPLLLRLEAGDPIVILAGLHIGCFELCGTHAVRTIRDLKGKTVAVPALDSSRYVFLASMVAYVGLDLHKDLHFVLHPGPESMRFLAEGKIDAYLGFPPNRRRCGSSRSARWWSTAPWTGPGRHTSVACWPGTASSCARIRWPPNGRSAPS